MSEHDDLYELIEAVCPRFGQIPATEKDVISRHMAGLGVDVIAAQVGRSPKSVEEVVERYKSLVTRVPEEVRIQLSINMLVNSVSTYAAVASDRNKIQKLSASDAVKTLAEVKKLMPEMMEMHLKVLEHKNKVRALSGDAFDSFGKTLGEGK